MDTLYLSKDASLQREDSTLVVKTSGGTKQRFPIQTIRHIVVSGESGLTSSLLALCGHAGTRITVLDWYGNVAGTFEPFGSPSAGSVRLAQAQHIADVNLRLELAKTLVIGTMRNLLVNLRYRAYRNVSGLDVHIKKISGFAGDAASADSIACLMGYEGNAKAWYFDAWPVVDQRLAFGPRRRRPPNNPINCLISWYNGLAYSVMRNEIAKTHLDGSLSFLHAPTEARHSLALDLAEPFKPAIVDTLIIETVMRNQIDPDWFIEQESICRLTEKGRKATLESWTAKLETSLDGAPSFRDLMRGEALAIERHVLGISAYKTYVRKI